jgi:GTPase SAR1 family protein
LERKILQNETSAKLGTNVKASFEQLIESIYEKASKGHEKIAQETQDVKHDSQHLTASQTTRQNCCK